MTMTNYRNGPNRFIKLPWVVAILPLLAHAGETIHGRVIHIADGDTITVLVDNTPYKIRLAGIDAPEKAQAFGTVSMFLLRVFFAVRSVVVVFFLLVRFGCLVGNVLLVG